jgi:hypothetical protein
MKNHLMIFALLLALCGSLYFTNSTSQAAPAPQTWEYKFEYKMNEKKANQLGAEGWELAAIVSTSTAGIGTNVPAYVFKRPK